MAAGRGLGRDARAGLPGISGGICLCATVLAALVVLGAGGGGRLAAAEPAAKAKPVAEAKPIAATEPAAAATPAPEGGGSLRVMTLNLAHGRGTEGHQATQTRQKIAANLAKVAELVRRHRPDVLALQEADGPSVWSGLFDHVQWLSDKTQMAHRYRGAHVDRVGLCYGTALVSRYALAAPFSVAFSPSPPTPTKGFVAAKVAWPGRPDMLVQVVSVHLDFARPAVRARQVDEMAKRLAEHKHPRVVMGDFNAQWSDRHSAVRAAAEALGLRAYQPESDTPYTFGTLKRRLDWILISEELEFEEYVTLPEVVSDHRAVMAVLRLAGQPKPARPSGKRMLSEGRGGCG